MGFDAIFKTYNYYLRSYCSQIGNQTSQSAGAVEYIDYISVEGIVPHPMRVVDMTLNNQMLTLQ